jgi:alcohol dehydrogenase class IV
MVAILLPKEIHIGGGTLKNLPGILKARGFRAPILITDPFILSTAIGDEVLSLMRSGGLSTRVFSGVVPDPTTSSVYAAVEFIAQDAHDCVVAVGGGSAIDTAKAAAVLARRGGKMSALKSPHNEYTKGLPIIAVPTTAGTGSEATRFTVVTDDETGEKMLCPGSAYLPDIAIVDYELTLTKPKRLTADTGIDALTHAIEAYVSSKASPFTDTLALAAMGAISANLRRAFLDPMDRAAREGMMLASLNAGIAFSNSSVALVHGMSRPIGAHFHVPHGLSNAMLLPAVTAWSAPAALDRYKDCAVAMSLARPADSSNLAVDALVAELQSLNADFEVPSPKAYGIDSNKWVELLPLMAEQALASGSPNNNPRIPAIADIVELYYQVWV